MMKVGFIVLATLFLTTFLNNAFANTIVNLPTSKVSIEVVDGKVSYYNTTLTDIPSGYDVENGTYLGWCVDRRVYMPRNHILSVTLYSSNAPPENLTTAKWDMVNYILNHKRGNATDVQQAIWHFINMVGNYTPESSIGKAIVTDAEANGNGFVPQAEQALAVICYPTCLQDVQVTIIEVQLHEVIPEYPSAIALMIIGTTNALAVVVLKRKLGALACC
jgi:hypothetical protein